jgi:uncharacterized membrane protein
MAAYHGLWDWVYLFGHPLPWYQARPGAVWQTCICVTFILLSGFCAPLGRHPFRRGSTVLAAGVLVTLVTVLAAPDAAVHFGILTFLGSAMLLLAALRTLGRRFSPPAKRKTLLSCTDCLFSLGIFLFLRPLAGGRVGAGGVFFPVSPWFYQGTFGSLFGAFLGTPPAGFSSTDYFPLLPWFFLFLTGFYAFALLGRFLPQRTGASGRERPNPTRQSLARRAGSRPAFALRPLAFLGRHTLPLYLAHQPLLFFTLWAWHALAGG